MSAKTTLMYLIYILADRSVGARSGAPEAPIRTFIVNGNLSIPHNFRLGKGVSDMYVAFLFGAKVMVLGANNGVA